MYTQYDSSIIYFLRRLGHAGPIELLRPRICKNHIEYTIYLSIFWKVGNWMRPKSLKRTIRQQENNMRASWCASWNFPSCPSAHHCNFIFLSPSIFLLRLLHSLTFFISPILFSPTFHLSNLSFSCRVHHTRPVVLSSLSRELAATDQVIQVRLTPCPSTFPRGTLGKTTQGPHQVTRVRNRDDCKPYPDYALRTW